MFFVPNFETDLNKINAIIFHSPKTDLYTCYKESLWNSVYCLNIINSEYFMSEYMFGIMRQMVTMLMSMCLLSGCGMYCYVGSRHD